MSMNPDDRKAISLILFYTALLFSLIGLAARMKSDFHARLEISKAGFVIAAVLAAFGVVMLLFSSKRKQG